MFLNNHNIIIIEDSCMVEDGESYNVPRTWNERLFSLPWKPFKAMRTIILKVPRKDILRIGKCWIMHPTLAEELRRNEKFVY